MVYGRILYNSIKEYTPKWYPTIPYSQTVKPTFSIFCNLFQKDHPKSSQSPIPLLMPKLHGERSLKYSNIIHGCGKFSSSEPLLRCITQFTSHWLQFIKQITLTERTMQQLQRKKLTRRNSDKWKKLNEVNDLR